MSAFVLKVIALATMIIDHTGAVFEHTFNTDVLRVIGRLSFPLYAFLIANGCKHTRSIKKYMLRLAIFAVISEIPFELAFMRLGDMSHQNIFFTLALGVLAIMIYEKINSYSGTPAKIFKYLLPLPVIILGDILSTDYGAVGVFLIFAFYLIDDVYRRAAVMLIAGFAVYTSFRYFAPLYLCYVAAFMLALIPIQLYNGEKGRDFNKWAFYIIYPAHLLILAAIKYFAL